MTASIGLPVFDTMIGFPHEGFDQYDFIRKQTKDADTRENLEFPVEYMFKEVPKDLPTRDPVAVTLHEMDRYGIQKGLIGVSAETSQLALKRHPDRFLPSGAISDPNDVVGSVRAIQSGYQESGIRATSVFRPARSHRCRSTIPRCTRSTRHAWSWASRSSSAPACQAQGFRSRRRMSPASTS